MNGTANVAVLTRRIGRVGALRSWPIVDTGGETVVLVGLKPGPHTVRLELADATHRPIPGANQVVEFTIPQK